jgi:ribA/ribD-fused uncharacterized protein
VAVVPQVIREFKGDYKFLSNFTETPLIWEGLDFRSVEHAFQAAKIGWRPVVGGLQHIPAVEKIRAATTAREAKKLGRSMQMVENWDAIKLGIMLEILARKFSPYRSGDLDLQLVGTGDATLIEGNTWGDLFWGRDFKTGQGQNWLGVLLMVHRSQLQSHPAV